MLLEEQTAPSCWGDKTFHFQAGVFCSRQNGLSGYHVKSKSRAGVENEGEVKDANQGGRTINNDGIRISAVGCITDLYQEQTMRN